MQTQFGHFPESVRIHHETRKKATRLDEAFVAEYPALGLFGEFDEDVSRVTRWAVVHLPTETEVVSGDKVPELAEALETCQEQGLDPEAGAEESDESQGGRSVVPESYRKRYREVSTNGQGNGDWLHEWLVSVTTNPETGKLDTGALEAIFSDSGLDMSARWAQLLHSGQKGAVGRYRMNGRQLLEKIVAEHGSVQDGLGNTVEAPESFVAAMQGKHAKYLAKLAKQRAAAEKAVREAVEAVEGEQEEEGAAA